MPIWWATYIYYNYIFFGNLHYNPFRFLHYSQSDFHFEILLLTIQKYVLYSFRHRVWNNMLPAYLQICLLYAFRLTLLITLLTKKYRLDYYIHSDLHFEIILFTVYLQNSELYSFRFTLWNKIASSRLTDLSSICIQTYTLSNTNFSA